MPREYVRTPWLQALYDTLADGQWHPIEEVQKAMEKAIDPAAAAAAYRTLRERRHKKPNGQQHFNVKAQDVHDKVRDGRRMLARRVLVDTAGGGQVEIVPPGRAAPNKRVRLKR